MHNGNPKARNPTVVEEVVLPAASCAGVGPLSQVITRLTGSALVASTTSAALTGRIAPFTTSAVTPVTLWTF